MPLHNAVCYICQLDTFYFKRSQLQHTLLWQTIHNCASSVNSIVKTMFLFSHTTLRSLNIGTLHHSESIKTVVSFHLYFRIMLGLALETYSILLPSNISLMPNTPDHCKNKTHLHTDVSKSQLHDITLISTVFTG